MNSDTYYNRRTRDFLVAVAVLILLASAPLFLVFFYQNIDGDLTSQVLSQQKTVATITATAIKLKLDHLVVIAESMVSSTQLIAFAARDQWNDAVNVTRDLQNNPSFYDSYIDRVVLFDENGTERAAYPTLASGIGSSATTSAWYQAINAGASFYLSDVTERIASPRLNVVNAVVPIMAQGKTVGFLALQIPTTDFLEFGQSASLGAYGFIYVVDSKGNVVIHPKLPSDNGVINLDDLSVMQRVFATKQGVSSFPDQSGALSLVGYQQVPNYNWEVVTQEPYTEAFSTRDSILWLITWEIIAAALVDLFIACLIFFFMAPKKKEDVPGKRRD